MKFGTSRAIAFLAGVLLLVQLTPRSCHAQARPSSKANVASVDLLGLATRGPLNLQYEFKAGPVNSWALRLHYWPGRVDVNDWSAFGLGGAYRFYIADSRALTGLSVAPAADIYFFSASENAVIGATGGTSATVVLIGGDLEYKWIFDQFSVEPLFGLRIGYTPASSAPGFATGFLPILALYLGYAW